MPGCTGRVLVSVDSEWLDTGSLYGEEVVIVTLACEHTLCDWSAPYARGGALSCEVTRADLDAGQREHDAAAQP